MPGKVIRRRAVGWPLALLLLSAGGPEAGAQRLAADVGPDWAVVQEYLDEQRGRTESNREGAVAEDSSAELSRSPLESVADQRGARRAVAAAMAILEQDGAHDKTVEAAEFLIKQVLAVSGRDRQMYAGAKALLVHAPDYEDWPRILSRMDARRMLPSTAIDAFFDELASEADDPVLRATGRYYVAAGSMRAANGLGLLPSFIAASRVGPTAETEAQRQRALEAATGLSAGVAEEQFLGTILHGPSTLMTLAEVEADLIRSIRHGTVGGTLPEVMGTRLDGVEESLADYRGRVVLLDFWATWCKPCIYALPDLRKLVAEVPADLFALIAISVDDQVETVTRFMESEPMPWTNWHAGMESDIGRLLRVQGYPTYVLVDEQGTILARTTGWARLTPSPGAPAGAQPEMPGSLPSLVRQAVARLSPE